MIFCSNLPRYYCRGTISSHLVRVHDKEEVTSFSTNSTATIDEEAARWPAPKPAVVTGITNTQAYH